MTADTLGSNPRNGEGLQPGVPAPAVNVVDPVAGIPFQVRRTENLAAELLTPQPSIGILVLSQYVGPSYALRLLEDRPEGIGYLLKERVFDVAILADALRRIRNGETVVDPTIVSRLVGRHRRPDPLERLSSQEREVLELVAEGMSNKAVAARLFITERTVEAHMTQMFQKLGLTDDPQSHRRVRIGGIVKTCGWLSWWAVAVAFWQVRSGWGVVGLPVPGRCVRVLRSTRS